MQLYKLQDKLNELAKDIKVLTGVTVLRRPAIPMRRRLSQYVKDSDLIKVSERLFEGGHHARAVEEAFKLLNNLVKQRSGKSNLDGAALMRTVLSSNSPILKLNAGVTQSERDEQMGYMDLCAGSMTGIRNPRAHEHDWEDSEDQALQMLIFADHLIGRIKMSIKASSGP